MSKFYYSHIKKWPIEQPKPLNDAFCKRTINGCDMDIFRIFGIPDSTLFIVGTDISGIVREESKYHGVITNIAK